MSFRFAYCALSAGLALIVPAILTPAQTLAETAPRISGPVVHENVAVYLIHGTSAAGPVPQTLQEAMAKGTVVVHETGNVQQLEIENKGAEPVFVQFGDIVKGGQQDRVLTVSLLLDPKSGRVPIGAYCVEQGRWAARGKEDVKRFAISESLMPSREAKIAMAKPAASASAGSATVGSAEPQQQVQRGSIERRLQGVAGSDGSGQSEVWRSVNKVQDLLGAALSADLKSEKSRTSLQLALEHEKLKEAQVAYVAALEPGVLTSDDVIGVVVAVDGRVSGADIYPSNALFRKMWPKIARAAATEALSARVRSTGRDGTAAPAAPAATAASPAIEAIAAFLKEAETGAQSERDFGTLAKIETRDGDKALRVEARNAKGILVHKNYMAK